MSFIRAIKEWHQKLKYRRQRARKGWGVKDTWSIDCWFLAVMPQMLEYLKEHHMGFPSEIQKEYVEAHSEELNMTYEEYCSWPADEKYKETSEFYLKESIKLDEYRDRCKTEAINLFNRWLWNLWD